MKDLRHKVLRLTTAAVIFIFTLGCSEGDQSLSDSSGTEAFETHVRIVPATGVEERALGTAKQGSKIDFARQIRPILSDRCFACHGPDAAASDKLGGFRLDMFETATALADSGKAAIVPGKPDESEMIRRIKSKNPNLVMPPPDSHLKVTKAELDLLVRWIEQGAEYAGHWAYQSPVRPELPVVKGDTWSRNAIDSFILSKLNEAGLSPSLEADRETLIRRVSLDLTGLPPTPEEIDAFVSDKSGKAYENIVDRLLSSPHFGERMAVNWLDAARYADTNGFHHDNIRTAWPWRQWVIESFNENKPYDQFVIEQLAGDLLPNATQEQILATAFCRMHNINDEGGALEEEYIVEAHADRIETIATVFMAQTFNCARCHDHKYDPTTQEDYFSLVAYFNSVDGERGVYPLDKVGAVAYPPYINWVPDGADSITEARTKIAKLQAERDALQPKLEQEFAQWEKDQRTFSEIKWADSKLTDATSSHPGTTVTVKPDQSALLGGVSVGFEDITLKLKTEQTGLRVIRLDALTDPSHINNGVGRAGNGNAVLTHIAVKAVSVADPSKTKDVKLTWAWADYAQPNADYDIMNVLRDDVLGWALGGYLDDNPRIAMFVADEPFGFEGGTELQVTLKHSSRYAHHTLGRVRIGVASATDKVLSQFPVTQTPDWFHAGPFPSEYQKALQTRFGPEDSETIGDYATVESPTKWQWIHNPGIREGFNNVLAGENTTYYFGRTFFSPVARQLSFTLGSDDGVQVYHNGKEVYAYKGLRGLTPDSDKVTLDLAPGENRLVIKVINAGGQGGFFYRPGAQNDSISPLQPLVLVDADKRPANLTDAYFKGWTKDIDQPLRMAQAELEGLLEVQSVRVLIMKEMAEPRPAYLLDRGSYDKPKQQVERKPPSAVKLPMPEGAPNNRLGFAQWLVQPEHPLTGRVHVNRLWKMFFGNGIVKSVEDFGSQAEWPSHPGLLDYLAVEFVESGWDQKALVKQIVMSATYRQSALRNLAANDVDADNRLLSFFPRQRLKAEFIRDQALFAAGLLDNQIGGPSVKPYQPGDLWREVAIGGNSNTGSFQRGGVEDLYRRSMYTFWKKTSPPAQMQIFNAPTREFCTVSRDTTNTPLQVLTLWNDEQFLEAARVLAQRTLAESADDKERLGLIFRRCTGELPNADELAVLQDVLTYYRERYIGAIEDAKALLAQGEYPLPENHEPAELASWMMVASTALSLDETIVRD